MYKVIYRLGLVFVLCGGYLLYVEANSDTNAIPRPIVDPGAQGKPANELSPAPAVESVENVQSPPMSDATAGFPVEGAGQNIPQPISEAVPAPEATSANASMPTAPAAPPAIAEPAPETKAPTEEVPALPPSPVPASVVSVPNEVNQKKRATRISAARKNEPEAVSAPTLQPTELPVGLKTEKITTAPAVEEKKPEQNIPAAIPAPSAPQMPVPELPQVPSPQPAAPSEEENMPEPQGIDTVDIQEPSGNWLFKRIWWEKSKEIYGKIRDRVDKIVESRIHFFKERVKLDREVLDPFYVEIGLDQGALQESVEYLMGLLKTEPEQILSPEAQEKFEALQEEKDAIAQLGESIKTVRQTDGKLDDALEKLMEQINLARSYESEAWHRLDQIAQELSDKKAREDYYAIITLWHNVKDIANYIQGPFAQHFIQLAQASVQSVKNIKGIAEALQQKGFALKDRVKLIVEEEAQKELEEEEEMPVQPTPGWGASIWNMITAPFRWIGSLFGF